MGGIDRPRDQRMTVASKLTDSPLWVRQANVPVITQHDEPMELDLIQEQRTPDNPENQLIQAL